MLRLGFKFHLVNIKFILFVLQLTLIQQNYNSCCSPVLREKYKINLEESLFQTEANYMSLRQFCNLNKYCDIYRYHSDIAMDVCVCEYAVSQTHMYHMF